MKNPVRHQTSGSAQLSRGPNSVTVTAPARLHLGFLDLNGALGRRFGSIGLAIADLRTRVTVSRSTTQRVDGPDSERARRYLECLQASLSLDGAYHVHVTGAIPEHAGFGSGTQLALALAAAIRTLHDMPLDIRGDAFRLGRGRRSGVGIGLFSSGGVVVDGGSSNATRAAPIVSRIPFPDDWRVVIVLDRKRVGVHGQEETAAFGRLPPFPASDAAHMCRLVLMQALLGAYFAPLQGGHPFASRDVATALELLESEGALGIGQSSWGPTGFAFVRSPIEAKRLVDFARMHPRCEALDVRACKGVNRGAEIETALVAA